MSKPQAKPTEFQQLIDEAILRLVALRGGDTAKFERNGDDAERTRKCGAMAVEASEAINPLFEELARLAGIERRDIPSVVDLVGGDIDCEAARIADKIDEDYADHQSWLAEQEQHRLSAVQLGVGRAA